MFGGEPLLKAWDGHLRALARTLGPHAGVLRTDSGFQSANQTIRALVAQQEAFTLGQPAAIRRMQAAYAHAIDQGYRFFSYGDACLLTRAAAAE